LPRLLEIETLESPRVLEAVDRLGIDLVPMTRV
jgi:hypothetical protein